jgi:hypothetical protein
MSGYMDAIRQNNAILVRNLLAKVDCSVWEDTVLTHESKFGETLLTYACRWLGTTRYSSRLG